MRAIRRLDDLKTLPFITKEEIRAHFPNGMVARGVNMGRCRLATTTGSTGNPLTFILSLSTVAYYLVTIMRVYVKGNDVADGEIGEIVLTTMRSADMPFIRYKIGDMGSPSGRVCACGCRFPLMESLEGRCDASLIFPSGKILLPYRVLNCFIPIITQNPHLVDEFRIVQKERDLVVVQIVKGREYIDRLFQETIENLRSAAGEPLTVVIEEILATKGAKRNTIESWVPKS